MKNVKFKASIAFILFCLVSNIHAQTASIETIAKKDTLTSAKSNYFLGKWELLVLGLPQGDTKFPVVFEMVKDTTSGKNVMAGHIDKSESGGEIKFSKVEAADTLITFYFRAQGYDLVVNLAKKDDDTSEGRMIDMFDVKATRNKK